MHDTRRPLPPDPPESFNGKRAISPFEFMLIAVGVFTIVISSVILLIHQ